MGFFGQGSFVERRRGWMIPLPLALIAGLFFTAGAGAEEPLPETVYWKQMDERMLPDAGMSVVEPDAILVIAGSCGGCGYRLVDLTWENWGSDVAIGTGLVKPLLGGSGDPKAKIYLSKVSDTCGERRYMGVRTVIQGYSNRYPDVDCRGRTGDTLSPAPPARPSKPKQRLKLQTAKTVFVKTATLEGRFTSYRKQSVRCHRVTSLRFRCRGRWIYQADTHTYRLKGAGWVKRRGRYYYSLIRFRVKLTGPEGTTVLPADPQRGFFTVR